MANIVKVLICLSLVIQNVIGNMEGYVYGGTLTEIIKHPHTAFLVGKCKTSGWICGASILNQNILITAGHCVNNCVLAFKNKQTIYLGHQVLDLVTTTRRARNIIRHKHYDDDNIENDIAVVLVDRPFPLGNRIKRVAISPIFPPVFEGFVAGWGSTEVGKMSPVLKQVYQRLRSQGTCNQHGRLQRGVFCCTGRGISSPNTGDSGSGLIVNNFQQIGLVSYKVTTYPYLVVYTNMSYYYNWIKENTKKLICPSA